MNKYNVRIIAIAGSLILASCQSNRAVTPENTVAAKLTPAPAPKVEKKPVGIDGKWIPTNPAARSVYYNQFKAGKFVSRSPDGKKTIAAGSYKTLENGNIQMNWYSEARKANASALCKSLSASEMQCSSGGSVFNLRRA